MKFQVPTPQTPGFLRRMDRALEFSESFQSGKITRDTLRGLVDFLSEYITEPQDKEQAKEQLREASQEQFEQMLQAIVGGGETVPLASNELSNTGEKLE